MVKVGETEYDNGLVGDGNATKTTAFPGGGTAARVGQTWFDWQNRAVASKAGVGASESTSLGMNRPLTYADDDNLGEVVQQRLYDGDNVTIVDVAPADGVPDVPVPPRTCPPISR